MNAVTKGLYDGASNALCRALEAARACERACAFGDRRAAIGRYGEAWEMYGQASALLLRLPADVRETVEETRVDRLDRAGFLEVLARCGAWIAGAP